MPARMTATALGQGAKNAFVCGIGVLSFWLITAFAIQLFFGQSLFNSIGLALAVLWCVVFVWFLSAWLRGRTDAGDVLLDCGPFRSRWLFLIGAIYFAVCGVILAMVSFLPVSIPEQLEIAGPVVCLSVSAFWLVMATGRLQIRENGIWAYCSLIRWDKIGSYRWSDDSTLFVRWSWGPFSFLWQGALPVPRERQQEVDDLLAEYCTASQRGS